MLKQATIDRIASLLKLDAKTLSEAIKNEKETDVTITDDLEVLDKTTLETRDKNKYNEGKKAGREMLIKEIKKDNEIDTDTEDPKKIVEVITEKVKKTVAANPDARVTELEGTVTNMKKAHAKVIEERDQLKEQAATLVADTKLLGHFPANTFKALSREEMLQLIKANLKIEVRDGKEIVVKNGQPVLNEKTLEPVPVAEAIGGYFKERNWLDVAPDPAPGGRGGGNSNPGGAKGKFSKLSEVSKWVEEQGENIQGQKGQAMMQAAIKENEDIDMNN